MKTWCVEAARAKYDWESIRYHPRQDGRPNNTIRMLSALTINYFHCRFSSVRGAEHLEVRFNTNAALAQLVEHLICNQDVIGSIPVSGSNSTARRALQTRLAGADR